MSDERFGVLILGNQLFPIAALDGLHDLPVFMCEDVELCTYVKHHQQKIVLFLAAMREYADTLTSEGFEVCYQHLDRKAAAFDDRLRQFVSDHNLDGLVHFEIEDHFFAERIDVLCQQSDLCQRVLPSPMFLTSRDDFEDYLSSAKRPFMADFYKRQRQRLGVLMQADDSPVGGQWSFDESNRKKLPKSLVPPAIPEVARSSHVDDVIELVNANFGDHPGSANEFWWPVTRAAALLWFDRFLTQRFEDFGAFQDAISIRTETVFHSVLSPAMNLGLLTPRDIVDRAIAHADAHQIPINSLEGFIRQIIGWREFIRGIYHHYDDEQRDRNFFEHHRGLTQAWYDGSTGIVPLDHAIDQANQLGWTHHISRLMVIGNLMTLCEIEPREAHDWFMETHVDSADWVMGPNVYGMALYSDGGIFATKPYICGSNYLLKMSDHKKGDWCDVVDGLYWRFINKHKAFFAGNPRLSMMARMLDRLDAKRRERIFAAAESFLDTMTRSP